MASTGARGPIKAGSGYIDIHPKLNAKSMGDLRTRLLRQMETTGAAAGRALSSAMSRGSQAASRATVQQHRAAQRQIQAQSRETAATQTRLEREMTRLGGQQALNRFRTHQRTEEERRRLLAGTTAATRAAVRQTLRDEETAARQSALRWRQAEQSRAQMLRERQAAETRALRQMQQARAADLRQQLQSNRVLQRSIRDRIREHQDELTTVSRQQRSTWGQVSKSIVTGSRHLTEMGQSATEAGRLITSHLLTPLAGVAGMLTKIGVNNADMRMLGQLSMKSAGVSQKKIVEEMNRVQQYAIDTPFSLDTMHEYQMKLIRSVASNDKQWFSKNPATKTRAADKAATRSSDILQAVGDNMARAGNLKPEQFQRAMYAIDMIMDLDRTPTRNFRQLVGASGIPAQEFAQMLGYKNASAMFKKMGTPAKDGGGIRGQKVFDALLENWAGPGGAKGYGKKTTETTITGRLQQLKERASFELGQLFAKEDPKTGEIKYTKLGEMLIGKEGKDGERKGGLLGDIEEIGGAALPHVKDVLVMFFDVLGTFTGWIKSTMEFLQDHPGLRAFILQAAKIAAVAVPFLIAFGTLSMVVGKLGKTFGMLLKPAKLLFGVMGGLVKGLRGAGRATRQVGSGVRSVRRGRPYLLGYDERRDAYRDRDARRARDRDRFRRAGRENGRARTAVGYGRYGMQRLTGYSGLRDWAQRRGNMRRDSRDAYDRAREASRSGQYGEALRHQRRGEEIRREYRDNRREYRRAARTIRPTDSVDRQEQSRRAIRDLEASLRQADQRAEELRRQLRQVNNASLADLRNQLGGSASVRSAADQAQRAVRSIQTQGVTPVNSASTSQLRQALTLLDQEAEKVSKSVRDISQEVARLNERKLGTLRAQQIGTTKTQADNLKKSIDASGRAVTSLNGKSLKALRSEFSSTSPKVDSLKKRLGDASSKVSNLNRRSLASLRAQLSKLVSAVDKARDKIGTAKAAGSLSGRITSLNGRKLGSVTKQVTNLGKALEKAAKSGKSLEDAIKEVNDETGGGGSSGGKKKRRKKKAMGGVLPGYAPGVDSIPALLSPGEAILRPEVARRIGAEQIDAWNAAAARGQLSRYARGTSGAKKGGGIPALTATLRQREAFDISQIVRLFGSTVSFIPKGIGVGGSTGRQIGDWGAESGGGTAGSGAARKLRGILDYFTEILPELLRKTPSGAGQAAGVIAGAIAPSAGKYFWEDIWKGQGNILERVKTFLGHLFDPDTLLQMVKDGASGIKESLGALLSGVRDPKGFITGTLSELRELFTGALDMVVDTFTGIKDIATNPSEYAGQVWDEFYAQAKEAMPNTAGLFKFANGGIVPGYAPGKDRVHALLSPGEAVLRPEAVRALGAQQVHSLNRGAKAGKSKRQREGEVIPSPDSAAFAAEVQKIQQSLALAGQAIQQSKNSSNSAWTAISAKVKSSVDGSIKPSLSGWSQALKGPTTSATKSLQRTNSASMTAISDKIRSTKNSASDSFAKMRSGMNATESAFRSGQKDTAQSFDRMKSGLKSLEKSFSTGQKNINTSFGKVPTGVTKSVRKAIDFIQRAMIKPVNEKLLGPAKIGKIANLPQFATGGVVPGYSPGNDSVLAMLSPGESILRPEVTRALGKETIHALNGAAMKGQLPAFATGGIVGDWKKAETSVPGDFTSTAEPIINRSLKSFLSGAKKLAWLGGVMEAGAEKAKDGVLGQLAIKDAEFGVGGANTTAALRWARTQAGKPYQWGGNGDPSWDCSGFMSAIESVIRGEKPHRRWATGAFHGTKGPAGWVRDLKSPFMIGITNAGVGHTAGTLNGVNVESRGGDGVVVGKKARGYKDSLFTSRWGFKPAIDTGGKGSGAGRWSETVSAVLRELGLYSPTNLANVLKAIAKESGGNPKAVNNWDSNAAKGQASRGLLQTIPSTFAAYAGKYRSRGITDPYANVYAAVRYAKSRYGAGWAARMARPGGYWTGTISASPGLALVGENGPELVSFKGGERVRNSRQTEEILSARPAPVIHVYEAKHEDNAQAVIRGLQMWEALHATAM